MEGVVAGVVTGTMRSLLAKLTTLLEENYKLSKGVKKEIRSLREEMRSMNALLLMMSEAEELNAQQKEWRDKVRELSYDMEDCIDIFANDAGGGSDRAGIFKKLKAHYKIAKRIEELKARMVKANDCRSRYMLDSSISRPHHLTVDPRIQEFYEDDTARLVGTDRARDKIIGWLVEREQPVSRPCFQPWNFSRFLQELYYFLQNFFKTPMKSAPSKETKFIAIVGTGGVGKTALANQVYNMVKGQFDCKISVPVSRNPNWVKILSDVFSALIPIGSSDRTSGLPDECRLIGRIREHLKDKRYLIVFDDVWTKEALYKIACSLAIRNNYGSRVIITTRVEDVAWAWQPFFDGHVYKMEPLNDLDSRKLFNRRMFGSEHACPEQLEAVSHQIIKKCSGLPLAILSVASILACRREMVYSTEIWENLRLQLERNPGFESMRYVLNLGYNDLSLDLRTCMLYLGIFPEDSRITKDDLVKRWVAEGFVTGKHGSGAEEIAGFYFNELINRNMIQVADMDDCGDVLSCRVHDVMLDFIILKSTEENFITIVNDRQSTKGSLEVRRLSLQIRNSGCDTQDLGDIALVQARSLNFWGPSKCLPSLTKFLVLRVLHLDVYGSKSEQCDLSSISKFFQLKYLRIRGIDCNKLRRQLCELQHLNTLEILPTKPMNIEAGDLPMKLWHLVVSSTVKLIGRIDRMKALRTLEELDIDLKDVESSDKGLGELTDLRELTLSLSHDARRGNNVGEFLLSSLCRLISLNSLTIYGSLVDADTLVHWHSPPCDLRRLHALA